MARLWSSGGELNSTTLEGNGASGSNAPVMESATIRSGTYSFKTTTATFSSIINYNFGARAIVYARAYIYLSSLPTVDLTMLNFISGAQDNGYLLLKTDGTIQLWKGFTIGNAQIGSASSAISTGAWHYLELFIDTTTTASTVLTGRVDGVQFASGTENVGIGKNSDAINFGITGGSASKTVYFDDLAINDSSGSFHNSWPGEGKIIHLKANAAGDNSDWTNDYTNVDETTPDDASTLVSSNTSNHIDDHNIEAPAMGTSDTVNVVQVGCRFNGAGASANASFVLRIKASASGTVEESSAITPSNTTWVTNAAAAPRNYSLTLYDLPGASTTAWTKSDLDNAQIGYRLSSTSTNAAQISTVWLLVDYIPSPSFPVYDSQSTTNGVTVSSLTWSHTCSTSSNRLLVVGVQVEDASASDAVVSSITYNSVALTKIRSDVEGAGPVNRSELWYLIAPSTGANNIVVTFAGTVDGATAGAVSFTNALQSGQPNANNGFNQGSNTSITVDVTSTTDNCIVVDSMCSGTTAATLTGGARQTENYNALSTGVTRGGGSMEESGGQGATTMSWSFSTTSTRSAISAAAFAPYVAAGGGGTFFYPIQRMRMGMGA